MISIVLGTGVAMWSGAEGWYHALNPWLWLTTWSKLAWVLLAQSLLILPVIAWVMLASAWARKAPFLWATVPLGAIITLEFWNFDRSRLVEWFADHMVHGAELSMRINENGRFGRVRIDGEDYFEGSMRIEPIFDLLWSGTLWQGVFIAAVFLGGAVWLRRYRAEPE
jgi:ABC-2 type transport system permease protein